ncbi:uncharacterized protein LOC134841598 [Symsagittifera roscoffensis]|uniref:uncharacterized protein LOC134841598 n=1 Tax=Symsagittifera roscoffensis TaxID=84072 RepID=UPI00307C5CB5
MKARYLPVVLWSLLYISVAFLAQGTIAIYGLAFANIAELAKYEASMGHVRVNWVVCGVCFLLYFSLLLLFLCGVTIQKYKAHSTKRLEDWIAVLVGVVTMASIVNGLSVWSYGLVSIGNLHHFMMRDKPCCFAGRTPALDIHNQYMQQQSSSLSCVCIDFSECFPENPSSECSTQIENRVATYCYMLQFMQYATSGFVVVEILLLLYSLVLVCKANKEHPINREKFRTYDEYKMIRESLRREKKEMKEMRRSGGGRVSSQMSHMSQMSTDMMGEDESEIMQREGVEETNYDENAANEFDRQLWSKDGTQYGINGDIYEESLDGSEDDNVPSILPNISPKMQVDAIKNIFSKH